MPDATAAPTDAAPLRAMGMVTAPFAKERRQQVRDTMLQYPPVLDGRIVFRFIVGKEIHGKQGASPQVESQQKVRLLREANRHNDIFMADAIDGAAIEVACSCVEKTTAWVRHALRTWPSTPFIGKTEDDTYVQLGVLEAELRALLGRRAEHRHGRSSA